MKTKNVLYTVLMGVFGLLLFQACQDDPAFPDPGFEISDQRVEVRRDTADYYNVHMRMTVPNKVKEILVLDGLDYSLVETITDYNGKTNFDFDYVVDLTDITVETVLNYIIKVTDEDGRSFNRGIRIHVQPFSFPEIDLVGGSNVAVAAPAYNVRGTVSTGLNTISSIKVIYNGKEFYSFTAGVNDEIYEMDLKALVYLTDLEIGDENQIEIIIKDNTGQESTTIVTVRKTDTVKKPYRVNIINNSGTIFYLTPTYDAEGKIVTLDYHTPSKSTWNYYEFKYNELNMVDTIIQYPYESDGSLYKGYKYFTYINYVEGTTQLSTIEYQENTYDEVGNLVSVGDIDEERFNFVYDVDGNVDAFDYSRYTAAGVYYDDPFDLGESIFVQYWQAESYMRYADRIQIFAEFDPVLMPTYMEGLPPFCNHISIRDILNDIFWNKYMPLYTESASNPSSPYQYLNLPKYTYETDVEGNITEIVKVFTGYLEGNKTTYLFFYDEI